MSGCSADLDLMSVSQFPIAYIFGKHFKSGEWGKRPRCGSVMTCVLDSRSLYFVAEKFLQVEGDECPGYVRVSWFSEPQYLLSTFRSEGRCRWGGS